MKKIFFIGVIIFLSIIGCKSVPFYTQRIEAKQININKESSSEAQIENFIAPYRKHIEQELDKKLAYNPTDLVKKVNNLNTPLGNMMADAAVQQATPIYKRQTGKEIDFSLFNWGGVRSDLPKGNVTVRSAFDLMPFENTLVVVELSGDKIFEIAQYLIKENIPNPVSKQFELHINAKKEIVSLKINGKPVQKDKIYTVCTTDYLTGGGDRMYFFKNPISFTDINYQFRKALIDYFTKIKMIEHTQSDNRFIQIN